jgi:hypothetical protein
MRFFVAKGAPQNDSEFLAGSRFSWRFALEAFCGVGGCGKAVAEPPQSKSSRADRYMKPFGRSGV